MNDALTAEINRLAAESIVAGRLPAEDALTGVQALDLWHHGPDAAMLFWVEQEADLMGSGDAVYYDVYLEKEGEAWRPFTGAKLSSEAIDEPLGKPFDALAPGLHRFFGSSRGPIRLTWAVVSPEVVRIRLIDRNGAVHERTPGRLGFVLFGITAEDPITYAYALDQAGAQLPSEPLLL